MSYTKKVTLWCDVEGCPNHFSVGTASVAQARRLALNWCVSMGNDLCPTCQVDLGVR